MVSVHGLSPAHYLQARDPVMPTLATLAARGLAAETLVPIFPPASYPAHTTLVTGRLPAHHGIPADRLLGERGVRAERYAHASRLRATTLWQAAAASGLAVAALDWPATGGASIAGLLPDVAPLRAGESWAGLLGEWATPWLLELAIRSGAEAPAAGRPGPERDAVLAEVACALMESQAPPALLLLRLSQTRAALAEHGPGSEQAKNAFARADAELAELIRCLERAGHLQTTALVVVGDHGTLPVHTVVRPNVLLAEAGLVTANKLGNVLSWRSIARSNGGSAFVYAAREEDAVLARRALREGARATRAFRVMSAQEMLSLGADPEAWFGLEAEPGYRFEDTARGPTLGASTVRAAGGYVPERAGMAAGLVAWGPGLRTGVRVPVLSQLDVAPTLAELLGLNLGEVDGRAVVGLLDAPPRRGELKPKRRADGG